MVKEEEEGQANDPRDGAGHLKRLSPELPDPPFHVRPLPLYPVLQPGGKGVHHGDTGSDMPGRVMGVRVMEGKGGGWDANEEGQGERAAARPRCIITSCSTPTGPVRDFRDEYAQAVRSVQTFGPA